MKHELILASAGTGKTYQLSGRFLALLFGGVHPERILATTFTRKAAGEILDRVLKRLVEAAESPKKLAELGRQVAAQGGKAPTRADCVRLLAELARGLHRFRIRTLDAFFVQLAGVFALELGLPPEWRILEEDELTVLKREALADALSSAERGEILELLRALQKSGERSATRTVERALLSTVNDCRGAYLDSEPPAWDRIRVPTGLDDAQLAEVLAALDAMPLPVTKKGTPVKNWENAREKLARQAREGDWESALSGGFLEPFAQGRDYSSHSFTDAHRTILAPLLQHAAHVLLASVRRQNRASHAWLERFERTYLQRKDSGSGLSFDDVPRALAPPDEHVHAARDLDIGFRLDGKIDHLLLDEFQDTAPSQWRVLAPLAEEIVADGSGERSFFCVGDVKQSIYAWRSGEPRLLAEMNARQPALPPATELVENHRSSRVVLDAVDRTFGRIGDSPAFAKQPAQRAAARAFEKVYAEHVAARDLPGAVTLYEARPSEGVGADLPPLELAAERAAAIAREAPHATIAVLLRRNTHVARAIDLLRRRGLRASGEGGNPLTDSNAVLHVLSAVHLADHPGDSAAAFHLATSPLAAALDAAGVDPREPVTRAALSLALRQRLARGGFGELLGELLPEVQRLAAAGAYGPWDAKRFAQLVDLGYAFDRREELRASAFLDFVRETEVEDPSSTQVKVMTIHASKGLEFDAVILPELDHSMTLREPTVLRSRPDPAATLAGVSVARSHAVCALDPSGLAAIRAEEDQRQVQEALCLLYVAMTRAKHRLDLVVRAPKQGTSTLSYAAVLHAALCATESAPTDEPGVLWRHPASAARWWPDAPAVARVPAPAPRLPRFRAPAAPRDLPKKSPSAEEGGHTVDVGLLLRSRRSGALARGTLVHAWMEAIEWADGIPDDAALDALGVAHEPDPALRADALAALRRALAAPDVRALLARPPGACEVWRERDFSEVLDEGGASVLWTGSFDRVVLHRDAAGALLRAEIIDWKTDRVPASRVDERVAFYRPQLAGYRRVLARMTGLGEERIDATLAFLDPGVVRRLD